MSVTSFAAPSATTSAQPKYHITPADRKRFEREFPKSAYASDSVYYSRKLGSDKAEKDFFYHLFVERKLGKNVGSDLIARMEQIDPGHIQVCAALLAKRLNHQPSGE